MSGECDLCGNHTLECICDMKRRQNEDDTIKLQKLSMKDKIATFLDYFTTITKDESNFIESVLKWNDETKMAFMIAKKIFEEKDENGMD